MGAHLRVGHAAIAVRHAGVPRSTDGVTVLLMIRALVPFVHVREVRASIAFYETLGFEVNDTHAPDGESEPVWASLKFNDAQYMIARATAPIVADQQAILFYVYVDDVSATHAALREKGVDVGEVSSPFFNPRGEFRVTDPDGYLLMFTHYL
jgi:uncharacterized glyoxalase superfamily protein PhnB